MYSRTSLGRTTKPTFPQGSSMAGAGVSVAFGRAAASGRPVTTTTITTPTTSPKHHGGTGGGDGGGGVGTMPTMSQSKSFDKHTVSQSKSYDMHTTSQSKSFDNEPRLSGSSSSELDITRTHSGSMLFRRKRSTEEQKQISLARAQELCDMLEQSDDRELELNRKGVFQSTTTARPTLSAKMVNPEQAAAMYAASKNQATAAVVPHNTFEVAATAIEQERQEEEEEAVHPEQRTAGVDALIRTAPAASESSHQRSLSHSSAPPSRGTFLGKLSFASHARSRSELVIEPKLSYEENVDRSKGLILEENVEIRNPFLQTATTLADEGDLQPENENDVVETRAPLGQHSGSNTVPIIYDPPVTEMKKMSRTEKKIYLARQALNNPGRKMMGDVPGLC